MRRAIARGRMLPQSLSTDPRFGRLSLKAQVLYPLLWVNSDDQGRLSGDPDEIKYAACPNVREIAAEEVPDLLQEIQARGMIKLYSTSNMKAIQMLDWWQVQKLQWAWPSDYPPPEGWHDRLRYKKSAKEVVTQNWGSPENPAENLPENLPENSPENPPGGSPENSPESSPETPRITPLTTPIEKEEERGRGKSPELLGDRSSPPLTGLPLFTFLTDTLPKGFGRKADSREMAQLRDLEKEISAAGGATAEQVYDAFKEAALLNKCSVSYVRAVLLDWLGIPRSPPG